MDELFEKEKPCSKASQVRRRRHGTFIYMIYTISKKEGHQTVE
jgi:hypothetical protein